MLLMYFRQHLRKLLISLTHIHFTNITLLLYITEQTTTPTQRTKETKVSHLPYVIASPSIYTEDSSRSFHCRVRASPTLLQSNQKTTELVFTSNQGDFVQVLRILTNFKA